MRCAGKLRQFALIWVRILATRFGFARIWWRNGVADEGWCRGVVGDWPWKYSDGPTCEYARRCDNLLRILLWWKVRKYGLVRLRRFRRRKALKAVDCLLAILPLLNTTLQFNFFWVIWLHLVHCSKSHRPWWPIRVSHKLCDITLSCKFLQVFVVVVLLFPALLIDWNFSFNTF